MKPVIGVTPDFNAGDRPDMGGAEPTYFLRARYVRAIEDAGGVPLILPLAGDGRVRRTLLDGIDGLLLTGSGPDLPPKLYGERQRVPFKVVSPVRYEFELEIARLAADCGVPLLGICGGMQALNVSLGGSLVQDIPTQLATPIPHRQSPPATRQTHAVTVVPRTRLRRVTGRDRILVNSSHHQAVKDVAKPLVVSAVAPDGVIEAIEAGPSLRDHPFLLGVQWHPEFLYQRYPTHRRLFRALVDAARRTAGSR
ncbi:MAG TPA: gamma-glutamyl-gamma-aminobutyrate hydrolase family protein [Nitrospirales bacterium]|nr:gamma-glutamyl-gamma-aminobutyrate hydrolase family protein [Nitrospirales bacterium]